MFRAVKTIPSTHAITSTPISRPWVGGSALRACLAALMLAGASSPAAAATFFVDRANPNCTSSGPNAGTELTPYCTIQTAVNQRGVAGNTIIVRPGIYREQVSLTSGAAGSPLILQAAGPGVIVDGSDDYTTAAQWTLHAGDVWLASTVTWDPLQVFLDGARTDSSVVDPALLPARSYRWVSGVGLYVNAGGGNPATHQAMIGRRRFGFTLPARSFVTIDGFEITRTEDRGINMSAGCTNITISHNKVSFTNKMGIQAVGGSAIVISSNIVSDANDHGISFINGVTGSIIEDNETCRNALPGSRVSNGIILFGCPNNTIRRNNVHNNQDSGIHIQAGSNNCIVYLNRSWNNGDHGFDHLTATGTIHVGDVAYNNVKDGFSIEGTSTGTQLHNCIGVNNGVTTLEANMFVDTGSIPGFVSNHNIFWNSGGQPPVKWMTQLYPSVEAYRAVSGQDAQTLEADPKFVNAANGDFHLQVGSPAIDNGNSGAPNWPALDADGLDRFDVPAVANTGIGPVAFADRGAFEFRSVAPNGVIDTPSGNVAIVAGQSVNFTGTGSDPDNNTPLAFAWNFGGGATNSTAEDPGAVVFAASGVYTVTLTVTDAAGLVDPTPDTRTITVNVPTGPTAALSVTPATGNAPLSVTANASGSVPGSAPIVSYRFDFGDGTVIGPQPGATATHVYAAGNWTASVTVTDNLGGTNTASASVVVSGGGQAGNLVGNFSFETNTAGWTSYQGASLTRVQGGLDGTSALQVSASGNGQGSFGVDDSPNWVGSTSGASVRYRLAAWVRSASSTGNVRIQVRELQGTTQLQLRETQEVTLSQTWRRITIDLVTLQSGTSLDLRIINRPRVRRESFLVDSVSIVQPDVQVNTPPVARLSVTPSSGFAPLLVTADASASTDPGGTSLSYRFDFGDGTIVGPQPGATATHTYAAGNWACTVTVTDNGGLTDTSAVPVSVQTSQPPNACVNLVTNPSFETGLAGWKGVGATIAQVAGGSAGSSSCRVTGPASLASFYIEDSPRTIASSIAGANYRFAGSVRSEQGRGLVKISVREYVGGTRIGQQDSPEFTLSPSWQRIEVAYTPLQAGSSIYFIVKDSPVAASEAFDLDEVSICAGPPAAPGPHAALVVTPSSGTAPLPVTANASGSTVVGGTIVSYTFDFGDGTTVGPQPGATATHSYAAGNWTCTVTVTDDANRTSTATRSVTVNVPGVNQAPNGTIDTPTAAVSVLVGQSVSFTATATDPDNNLPLSRLWNFGGAAANSTVEDPGSIVFNIAGTYTVTFTVTDGLGLADPTPDTRVITVTAPGAGSCATNLATNPSFETGTAGWKGVGGTIAQVPGGSVGAFACRVTGTASLSSFYIEDSPRTINSSTAGVVHRFGASVRSDLGVGRVKISVREYVAGTRIGQQDSPEITLSPNWQRLEVAYAPLQAGSTIYFIMKDSPAALSESFDMDDVTICAGGAVVAAMSGIEVEEEAGRVPFFAPSVFPNPLVRQGVLRFSTGRAGPLNVAVYDVAGRKLLTLLEDANAAAGPHFVPIDESSGLGSGLFFFTIHSVDGIKKGRFLITK